jgi:hypothetical protein
VTPKAIKRLSDQLRARSAARLADPNLHPGVRRILEARPPPDWELEGPMPTRTPKGKRKPTLTTALTQAAKAGATVSGATITPDGSVALTFGEAPTTGNPWDEVLNAPNQKRTS